MWFKHAADHGIKFHNCGIQNSSTVRPKLKKIDFKIAEKKCFKQEFQNLMFIGNETVKLWLEDISELYSLKNVFIIALINCLFAHLQWERNQVFL